MKPLYKKHKQHLLRWQLIFETSGLTLGRSTMVIEEEGQVTICVNIGLGLNELVTLYEDEDGDLHVDFPMSVYEKVMRPN